MFCPKCGSSNPDSSKFCTSCGATLTIIPTQQTAIQPPPKKEEHGLLYWGAVILVIIFVLIIGSAIVSAFVFGMAGLTSQAIVPSSISSNSNSISSTCIGNCQIGQSATDGYYNFQKFTLNRVTRLHQPYFDPDPDPGFEWHNWDYLILNVTIESIRPEKSTEVGGISVKDANGKEITCAYHIPQQLTTIYHGDSIPAHQKVMGNIACYLQPNAKIPYNIEYSFLGFSNEESAKYSISSYGESTYANIEKNPKLGIPFGVKVNQ